MTFTAANPLRVIHVNGWNVSASNQVYLEVPTLDSVVPTSFDATQQVHIQAHGEGFGSVPGKLEVSSVDHSPGSWTVNDVFKTLPANTVSPGTVTVRVRHAAGVYSNPRQITAD